MRELSIFLGEGVVNFFFFFGGGGGGERLDI